MALNWDTTDCVSRFTTHKSSKKALLRFTRTQMTDTRDLNSPLPPLVTHFVAPAVLLLGLLVSPTG